MLSKVPQLSEKNEDKARRFVVLIDELYDRRVKLIMSAEVEIPSIYTGIDKSLTLSAQNRV